MYVLILFIHYLNRKEKMKLSVIFTLILTVALFADWVDFGIDGSEHAELRVLEATPSGMVIEITIPGVELITEEKYGAEYTVFDIPGATVTALAEGYPQLPNISFLAALPSAPTITYTIEKLNTVELGEFTPYPMQPIQPDNATEPAPFTVVPSAYSGTTYPSEQVRSTVDGILRGITVGRFSICPITWNADTKLATAISTIRVRIDFGGSVTIDERLHSPFFESSYRQFVNHEVLGSTYNSATTGQGLTVARTRSEARDIDGADLLIIAGDDFVDTMMDAYLAAKYEQGYITAVVSAGTWTSSEILTYIDDAYDSWIIPPSFLLIVGDGPDIPAYPSTTGIYCDNRYTCVDGTDYFSDIYYGRFCTPTDFYPFVEAKQLKWQFDPLMDADFWNNLLCAGMLQTYGGNTADRWFLFTCEAVHDSYEDLYGKTAHRVYVTDATVQPPYYYRNDLPSAGQQVPSEITFDGTTQDLIDVINDGVFLVQHRDHGSISGWGDPEFYISDLSQLTNGEETPVVFSFNCSTGEFNSNLCFAEYLARMDGGSVATIAACATSYSYFNDYIVYGMYQSFNDDFVSPPASYTNPIGGYLAGQAMTNGKLEMQTAAPFNPYGSWEGYAEDEWDLFQVFGDPTMDLRTAIPEELTVTAPTSLPLGSTSADFTVSNGSGFLPQALVCLRKEDEEIYARGLTDSLGMITLTFDSLTSVSEMLWMVTAHNGLPQAGIINTTGIETTGNSFAASFGTPFPNPASSMLVFPITMGNTANAELKIFDLSGRIVATIHSGDLEAGEHELVWDCTANDLPVPAGVYIVRFTTPLTTYSSKVLLVK